ncbi:LOW QUALITY PROTEIN: Voltage-gated potassium channel subunit [Phytophthora megakarya]|uniref:Voltage-gated potassium channel subunit n=1 Tax=Phytophthora megakarya TaxID=4795 RepID=A0A225WW94_9STRA|nr:LOW QUALITY PROTEIN: Voltage-gated potassium channel subunit [Phytophthora megakarya]
MRGDHIIDKRILRVDNSGDGRGNTEERVGNIFSKVSNYFKNNNAIRWADAFKSDDFVKEKFKLTGLSRTYTAQKLQALEKFVKIKKSNQLDAWLKADKSTIAVWRELGLGSINTWDDLMNAADTDAFKMYQRYADSFDNNAVINTAFKGKPIPVWSSDTSWTERIARMVSWKANKKMEGHIMLMLGFDKFSVDALEANQNAKTYLIYWLLKHDDSLNGAQPDIKDILKRLMKLENLPLAELTKLRNAPSLNEARHDTNILLKKLFKLEKLSSAEIAGTGNIQTAPDGSRLSFDYRPDKLKPIAKELGVPMAVLSISWCLSNYNVPTVLIGAKTTKQLEQDLEALKIVDSVMPEVKANVEILVPCIHKLDRPDEMAMIRGSHL